MKTWFGAAGRFCADSLLVLLLLVAISILGARPDVSPPSLLLPMAAKAGFELLPVAASCAIFLGFFVFEGRLGRRYRLVSWLSTLILGFGLLVGSTELRRLDLALGAPKPPVAALATPRQILDQGDRGLWAANFDEGGASKIIGFRAEAPALEGLSYSVRAEYGRSKAELSLASQTWSLHHGEEAPPRVIPGMGLGALAERMRSVDSLPLPLALAVLGGFALLAAGLVGFSRLPTWPLLGFFLAIAGFLGLLALDGALSGPEAARLMARFAPRIGLGSLSPPLLIAGIEGLLGLILGALTLPSWGRHEE